jgi:phage FluMu protein Com
MKPRDIINRRKKFYFIVVVTSFLAMAIVAYSDKYLPQSLYKLLSVCTITVFVAGVLLVYVGIRCPKCKSILGLKYVFAEETLKQCPKCGIVFDEIT